MENTMTTPYDDMLAKVAEEKEAKFQEAKLQEFKFGLERKEMLEKDLATVQTYLETIAPVTTVEQLVKVQNELKYGGSRYGLGH